MAGHGELAGEGKKGEGGGERGRHGELLGAPWGGAARSSSLLMAAMRVFCFQCEKKKTTGRRREEREKKEKRKKKKRKKTKNGKICKHVFFRKIK
jgi:hypothetical protein